MCSVPRESLCPQMPAGYSQSLPRERPGLHTERSVHHRLLHLDPEGQVSSPAHIHKLLCTHIRELTSEARLASISPRDASVLYMRGLGVSFVTAGPAEWPSEWDMQSPFLSLLSYSLSTSASLKRTSWSLWVQSVWNTLNRTCVCRNFSCHPRVQPSAIIAGQTCKVCTFFSKWFRFDDSLLLLVHILQLLIAFQMWACKHITL